MKKTLFVIVATLGLSLAAYADSCKKCNKHEEQCDKKAKCEKTCGAMAEKAFKKYDADNDGKLSLTEFQALMKGCSKKKCDAGKCDKTKK